MGKRDKFGLAIAIVGTACIPSSWLLYALGAPVMVALGTFICAAPLIAAGRFIAVGGKD